MKSDCIIALRESLSQIESLVNDPKPDNDGWNANVYQAAKSVAEIAGVATHQAGQDLSRTCRQMSELLEDKQRTIARLETRLGKQQAANADLERFNQQLLKASVPSGQTIEVVDEANSPIDEATVLDDETIEVDPVPTEVVPEPTNS